MNKEMGNDNFQDLIFRNNIYNDYQVVYEAFVNLVKRTYAKELDACYSEYDEQRKQAEIKLKDISEQRRILKADFKCGLISNKEFNHIQKQLYLQKQKLKSEPGSVLADKVTEIFVQAGLPEIKAMFMAIRTIKERLNITAIPHKHYIF